MKFNLKTTSLHPAFSTYTVEYKSHNILNPNLNIMVSLGIPATP